MFFPILCQITGSLTKAPALGFTSGRYSQSKDLDGLISKSQTHSPSDLLRTVSKDSTISGAQDYTKACLKSPEKPALLNPVGLAHLSLLVKLQHLLHL